MIPGRNSALWVGFCPNSFRENTIDDCSKSCPAHSTCMFSQFLLHEIVWLVAFPGAPRFRGAGRVLGVALIGTAPLDYISNRLQHLDYETGCMAELLSPTGLIIATQKWCWDLANRWSPSALSGDFAALSWWLDDDAGMCDSTRDTCCGLAAAVYCRLELKCPPPLCDAHKLIAHVARRRRTYGPDRQIDTENTASTGSGRRRGRPHPGIQYFAFRSACPGSATSGI